MNNEKMGRFISELRKSGQMTQKDLAQKLNVTDKAVSKWERGLSYPDIALLSPLAKELGITPGELLNGEKDTDAESSAEANIAIDNVLQYADNAVKTKIRSSRKRTAFAILAGTMLLWSLLLSPLWLWPTIARRANTAIQQRIVREFHDIVAQLEQHEIDEHFRRAEEHNALLSGLRPASPLLLAHMAVVPDDYMEILNVGGIMGRVEIPVINVSLPIFHGTTPAALDRGAGHMEGTSFPIGGYGSHSVITAHTGLSNARMFSDLERNVDIGDYFYIHVLDRRLVYRVDNIAIILRYEIEALRIIPDADIVTLMTCTPYRVNSHRLLVRGTRVQ